jgi:hypothetical protein
VGRIDLPSPVFLFAKGLSLLPTPHLTVTTSNGDAQHTSTAAPEHTIEYPAEGMIN